VEGSRRPFYIPRLEFRDGSIAHDRVAGGTAVNGLSCHEIAATLKGPRGPLDPAKRTGSPASRSSPIRTTCRRHRTYLVALLQSVETVVGQKKTSIPEFQGVQTRGPLFSRRNALAARGSGLRAARWGRERHAARQELKCRPRTKAKGAGSMDM